jgi:hypothetical protein
VIPIDAIDLADDDDDDDDDDAAIGLKEIPSIMAGQPIGMTKIIRPAGRKSPSRIWGQHSVGSLDLV